MRDDPWGWWRSIGSPRRVLAPMVGQSELAFRLLCRRYGADLCVTPMINAKSFLPGQRYRNDVYNDLEEAARTPSQDRPLLVQFCGDDPSTMLAAAEVVQDSCDGVDINLGCPQGIAKRGHYGAFLLEERDLVVEIVSLLSSKLKVPVTCKIRLLQSDDLASTLELSKAVVDAGASMLTVHGRTRHMKGQFVGACDWDAIRMVREAVGNRVPVIANGGVETPHDVERCLAATAADGVMVSEASLANPAIFHLGSNKTKVTLALEYLEIVKKQAMRATHLCDVRAHLIKLLYEIIQHPANTASRDLIVAATTFYEVEDAVKVMQANNAARNALTGPRCTWYRRHRAKDPSSTSVNTSLGVPCINRFDLLADDDEDEHEDAGVASLFDEDACDE